LRKVPGGGHHNVSYNTDVITAYVRTIKPAKQPVLRAVLAFGTQVRGFKPGQNRRIFRAKKILITLSFGGEVKPSVPCRSFTACTRSLNVTWKSTFRQNYRAFLAHSSTCLVLSRGDTRGDVW